MSVFSKPVRQPELHQQTTGIFTNADHTVILGGSFTNVNNTTSQSVRKDGFEILQEHVAGGAFHNSKQRTDPPRCYPGTRRVVLEELIDWVVGDQSREAWIAWLNGAAGAGKSALCQSLAEMCIQQGIKVASFFFFRTDSTRNIIDPVIATLAYQIIQLYPETKEFIINSIESHPLIFEQTFAAQLEVLIVTPIRYLQILNTGVKLLLILDGVDECMTTSAQEDLVRTCAELLQCKNLPLLVLFGSRREAQIQMAFNTREMDGILKQLPLDDNYKAAEDIELFLGERFDDINRTHPVRRYLAPDWPPTEHVRQIVAKSSGQFVYAAVVVKFVATPSSNPSTQLDIVRGLRPAGRAMPFAELDALYRHIFSQVGDIATALGFIAYHIIVQPSYSSSYSMKDVFYFFDIAEDDAESVLAPLTSVLTHDADKDNLVFYHASLPDFLQDQARSQDYHISEETWGTKLSTLWFKHAASGRFKHLLRGEENVDLPKFLHHTKPSPDLRSLILDYSPHQTPMAYTWNFFSGTIVKYLSDNDFEDDGELYRTKYDQIFQFVQDKYPDNVRVVKQYAPSPKVNKVTSQNTDNSPPTIDSPKTFNCQVDENTLRDADNSTSPKTSIRSRLKTWLKK